MIYANLLRTMIAGVLAAAPLLIFVAASDAAAESAKDNYNLYCVQCHGTKGVGKGINAPFLAVQPRNHTSAKDMGELRDADVFKAIKEGGVAVGKSTQMPSFAGNLSDDEVNGLVKLLRDMCKCVGKQ